MYAVSYQIQVGESGYQIADRWEEFETLAEARQREKYLKTGGGFRWRQQNGLQPLG